MEESAGISFFFIPFLAQRSQRCAQIARPTKRTGKEYMLVQKRIQAEKLHTTTKRPHTPLNGIQSHDTTPQIPRSSKVVKKRRRTLSRLEIHPHQRKEGAYDAGTPVSSAKRHQAMSTQGFGLLSDSLWWFSLTSTASPPSSESCGQANGAKRMSSYHKQEQT